MGTAIPIAPGPAGPIPGTTLPSVRPKNRLALARTMLGPVVIVAAACAPGAGGGEETAPVSTATTASAATSTATPSTGPATADGGDSAPPAGGAATTGFACETVAASSAGSVARLELAEASGLVASEANPGVLWSHNDSGDGAAVYAVGLDGRDLGRVELTSGGQPLPAVDIEDLALVDGSIWLADIGDNLAGRASVTIHRFDEPEVTADGAPVDSTVEVTRSVELRYDRGPTDAEAIVIDPRSGDLLVLGKDLDEPTAPTDLFVVPGPALTDGAEVGPLTAEAVGALDVASMTATSRRLSIGAVLYPGAVTGADISPAGDLIALRTYGSVWLFDRAPDQGLVEALGGAPCEVGVPAETQGEAVALLPPPAGDGPGEIRVATIGEGVGQPVNVTVVRLAR